MTKVLLAEDEEVTRRLLASILKDMGLVAIACVDGSTAWNVLQSNPDIELIVSDMQMPGLDGRHLVQNCRKVAAISEIPIVIVSGVVKLRDIADVLALGATYFVPKPIVRGEFTAYIENLLETPNSLNQPRLNATRFDQSKEIYQNPCQTRATL